MSGEQRMHRPPAPRPSRLTAAALLGQQMAQKEALWMLAAKVRHTLGDEREEVIQDKALKILDPVTLAADS
jgi:hypothetical protein